MARRQQMMPHLAKTYGADMARVWHNRWQIFHLASSEMFKTHGGDTWGVTHALFEKPLPPAPSTPMLVMEAL